MTVEGLGTPAAKTTYGRQPMRRFLSRPALVVLALSAALLVVGGAAYAVIPDTDGTVHACVSPVSGNVRAVDLRGDCRTRETAVDLGGPTRGYATNETGLILLDDTSDAMASLKLPPGRYLIHGKVNVVNFGSSATAGTFVPCSLRVGGTSTNLDQTWIELASSSEDATSASIGLQGAADLPAGGSVVMLCASLPRPGGPTNVQARYRQLDAIGVDSLTTSP